MTASYLNIKQIIGYKPNYVTASFLYNPKCWVRSQEITISQDLQLDSFLNGECDLLIWQLLKYKTVAKLPTAVWRCLRFLADDLCWFFLKIVIFFNTMSIMLSRNGSRIFNLININFVPSRNSRARPWVRKPLGSPTAKSKLFRVPQKPNLPMDETEEIRRLHNIYFTQMKSLRYYLISCVKILNMLHNFLCQQGLLLRTIP